MTMHKPFRGSPHVAAALVCALLVPLLSGCTIMDALDRRSEQRKNPAPPVTEHLPEADPQDQRVTLYVLGVDGVD